MTVIFIFLSNCNIKLFRNAEKIGVVLHHLFPVKKLRNLHCYSLIYPQPLWIVGVSP